VKFRTFFLFPNRTLLLFGDIFAGLKTTISAGDSVDQSFMWLSKIFMAVRDGDIVLWDFTIQYGVSFIGEIQTSPLYPLALLAGLIVEPGTTYGFDQFLLFHYLIAAIGMHLYCLSIWISEWGSFASALFSLMAVHFLLEYLANRIYLRV